MSSILEGLRLFSYWRSSSSWRVRAALALKGVRYDHVAVHLVKDGGEHRRLEFAQKNPMEQLPLVELRDGRRVAQSMAIIALLDEVAPEPPLLPTDPFLRARALMLAEIVNSGIQPVQNLEVLQKVRQLGGDDQKWRAQDAIGKGLRALEMEAQVTAGKFLVGDLVGLADLYLVPQLYNARRFSVRLDDVPTLTAIEARCLQLPAFQDSHPDRMPDAPRS